MRCLSNFPLRNDFNGKAVLISGGTRGIGLATGLAFGARGAHVFLTHRWGSADEENIRRRFAAASAPPPVIMEADASRTEENRSVINAILDQGLDIAVLVCCVCIVSRGQGLAGINRRDIIRSLNYNVRPLTGLLESIRAAAGRYPRYALAISSDGHLSCYPGYDYVGASKAALEAAVIRTARRLSRQECRVNAIRTRNVQTDSYREIFAETDRALVAPFADFMLEPDDVARVALALCGGNLDTISGEVIVVDKAARIVDNVMTMGPRVRETAGDSSGI